MKRKILATSHHPGGVNAILPVICALKDEGLVDIVTLATPYRPAGSGVQEVYGSEKIFQLIDGLDYRTPADYGLNNVCTGSMVRLIGAEKPHLILTGTSAQDKNNEYVVEQTATRAARMFSGNNILLKEDSRFPRSLAVLDYWANYSIRFSDIYNPKGKFKFLPDRIAIMDEIAREDMLKEGFPKEGLIITGNPHFDNLVRMSQEHTPEKRAETRARAGIPKDAYMILYATDITSDLEELGWGFTDMDCVDILCKGINIMGPEKDYVYLALKKHPREKPENLRRLTNHARESGINAVEVDYDARKLVLASDLVAGTASTVLIEATLMDRDALSILPGRQGKDDFILNKQGLIPRVYNKETGKVFVENIVSGRGVMDQFRKRRQSFRVDGKATERVRDLAYEMIDL